ncbi:MAG: DUF935 family protein [Akkermansia sp.]|nr:DUF935 family protein [Akkermansia sp.]
MMNIKTRLQGIAQRFSYAARHLFARTGRQVNVAGLALDILTQREQRNELPWLTPQRAVELYEAWRRGELADVQRVWEQLEETDDTLMTVLDKRQRALADMPWAILTDAEAIGDDAERARKAEFQQAYLRTVFNAVENLEEALVHLGMADFRGVAALEITGNMQRMRWEVIEPWCLARPVRRGPWMYNAKADVTFSTLEEMEKERIIVREARPIDLACMFLIVDKMHAIHGWDAFLDVFGNPSIFLELPQATNEQMAKVYDALAKRIIGDGRGTVPSGSKFQTVETRQNNCDSFEKRAKWCADAIITVATGGLLTVKAESGSGTLAGNAHADSFENLVAGSAASISATINKQFTRRLLAEAFPNDPPLAYFSLAPEPADERMRLAQLLATLKTAGWQPTQEKVAELMQMEVEPVPVAPTTAPDESAQPHIQPLVNRCRGLQPAEDTDTAEPPLNEGELEALRFLGAGLNPEQVAADAAFMAEAMRESTIDPSSPIGYAEAGELRSTKPDNAAPWTAGEEEDVEEPGSESPAESVTNAAVRVFKRDNLGRFAVTGAVLKKNKGGRGSRGKKMLGKTGSPNLIEAGDSKRKTKRALVKAFLKAKDGKKVSTGYKMGSHEVTLAPGDKEHWGTHHAERKEHPKKISSDKLAEVTLHGKRENDRGNDVAMEHKGVRLVMTPEKQPTKKTDEPLIPKKNNDRIVGKNWYEPRK